MMHVMRLSIWKIRRKNLKKYMEMSELEILLLSLKKGISFFLESVESLGQSKNLTLLEFNG